MKIKERIVSELKEAQKAKNSFKLSALRLIKSALDYKAMELKKSELDESETIKVLQNLAKQRKESIESYKNANREDSARKEADELKIIETFLPASVPFEKIREVVEETIAELSATSMKDMGKVMKASMEKFKGQTVDGKFISETVKSILTEKSGDDGKKNSGDQP